MRSALLIAIAATALMLASCQKPAETAAPAEPAAPTAAPAATAAAAPTATTVAYGGGTVETGGTCGTIAGLTCKSPKDYCKTKVGQCGTPDIDGVCTPKPEVCTKEFKPVCGCDGKPPPLKTYSNACVAASQGANVQSQGECKKPT